MHARYALILIAGLLALPPAPLRASAVVIWPVDPKIKPTEQATALWIENKGKDPVTMQVRTFAWSQPDGQDTLDLQDDIVASPPIAVVAPGERQLIRIIRRVPAPGVAERAYRLLIDELPAPPAAAPADAPAARLSVQMRYSVPLFVFAPNPAKTTHALAASIVADGDGRVLTLRNTGTGHARLTDLRLVSNGQEIVVKAGLAGYVLPGATVRFALPGGVPGTVRASVNGVDQLLESSI